MINLNRACEIVEEYRSRGSKAKKDLAELMEFEGIDTLVYRVYTPSFNDGDPCEFTVLFIGPPNYYYSEVSIFSPSYS